MYQNSRQQVARTKLRLVSFVSQDQCAYARCNGHFRELIYLIQTTCVSCEDILDIGVRCVECPHISTSLNKNKKLTVRPRLTLQSHSPTDLEYIQDHLLESTYNGNIKVDNADNFSNVKGKLCRHTEF